MTDLNDVIILRLCRWGHLRDLSIGGGCPYQDHPTRMVC